MLIYFTERFGGNSTEKTTTIESIHIDMDEAHQHKRDLVKIDPDDSAVWSVVTANLYNQTWTEFVNQRVREQSHKTMQNWKGAITARAEKRVPVKEKPVLRIVK